MKKNIRTVIIPVYNSEKYLEERDRISDKKRGDGHNSHPLFFYPI